MKKKVSRKGFLGISASAVAGFTMLPLNTFAESPNDQLHSVPTGFKDAPTQDSASKTLRIALAQLSRGRNIPESVRKIETTIEECGQKGVEIVCFPETYLPGLRGGRNDAFLSPPDQPAMEKGLIKIQGACKKHKVAAIVGMEWVSDLGLENRAFVVSEEGKVLGHQTKNQITPGGEDKHYVPDSKRTLFSIKGVPFGIVICHEGWRYPETVRWAAVRGAKIVFQPQVTGSNAPGEFEPKPWGQGAYYEMAMIMRSKENSIYFASVNEAMNKQNSATSLIDPEGNLVDYLQPGGDGLMVKDLDLSEATGFYASRYRPELYGAECQPNRITEESNK